MLKWKAVLVAYSVLSFFVFLINLVFTIWAGIRKRMIHNGSFVLYDGSCSTVQSMNTGLHLCINLLSMVLLSGSNYAMQCLSAPTRAEVDAAHRENNWLDIGIPSLKNLLLASRKKRFLWSVLLVSSLPLHLFYNAMIFASRSSNSYKVYNVPEAFTTQGMPGLSRYYDLKNDHWISFWWNDNPHVQTMADLATSNGLVKLEPDVCARTYYEMYLSKFSNLLLVTDDNLFNKINAAEHSGDRGVLDGPCGTIQEFQWICQQYQVFKPNRYGGECQTHCELLKDTVLNNIADWKPNGNPVKYCLAQPFEEHCKLRFTPVIASIVILLNLVKCITLLRVAYSSTKDPLLTLGDAISSFLQHPDPHTEDMCLVSKDEIVDQPSLWSRAPRLFSREPKRRFKAIAAKVWLFCFSLYGAALVLCAALLAYGISRVGDTKTARSLFSLGLGSVASSTVIITRLPTYGMGAIIANSLLANSPQIIFSLLYYSYNMLMTAVMVASEWDQFSKRRSGLRVSGAHHEQESVQQSTYFLQLPYRYGIPIVAFSTLQHWLMSQSIFPLNVDIYDYNGELFEVSNPEFASSVYLHGYGSFVTCGWSPVAVLAVITLGVIMVAFLFTTGMRRLSGVMPVAGSCSAAIASACHPRHDPDGWTMELQWGVVENATPEKPGHLAFTSKSVDVPQDGFPYAGR